MSAPAYDAAQAHRAVYLLAAAQAILGSAMPVALSIGGLAGYYLLGPDKSLATAPVSAYTVGVALGAIPAAAILKRMGQRGGFILGAGVTGVGGAVAAVALFEASFWLFVAGLLTIGLGGAFVQQFRFAAADNAPSAFKAKAISLVLAGGVVTAVLGPQIVIFTRELFAPVMFAGSFACVIALAVAGAAILSFLRPRPVVETAAAGAAAGEPARPLGEILRQPLFAVGLFCAVGTYALMSLVMIGAPLAMVGCGFSPDEATLGISWHVMAMFAPSFFTGRLIARFGYEKIVATGLALMIACALVALSGIALWQFWSALILLGLGWNFGFIGATAMVADSYRPSEKGKVQGLHDFILFGFVAFASLMAGRVYDAWGWDALVHIVVPVTLSCLLALAFLAFVARRGRKESKIPADT